MNIKGMKKMKGNIDKKLKEERDLMLMLEGKEVKNNKKRWLGIRLEMFIIYKSKIKIWIG